jgi:TRAP-type C4-dicarboxylate transport system permease small subunit
MIMARVLDKLDATVEYIVALVFAVILLAGAWQVFCRYVLGFTPGWTAELQIFGHILIVFFAIPIGYRKGAHLYMDSIRKRLPHILGKMLGGFIECLWAGFGLVLIIFGYKLVEVTANQTTPGLGISMSYPYLILVISGGYLFIVVARRAMQIISDQYKGLS